MPSSTDRISEALGWFKTSLDTGRMAHAYIVIGPPRTHARDFALGALRLLYAGTGATDPAVHPDVLWIEPQKKSRIVSIEQVREACHRMAHTSFAGGWKSCVIVGADRIGDAAANAFLKTLEEPRGQSIFLLLTDQPEALLPTIVSRCQRITLSSEREALPGTWRDPLIRILQKDGGPSIAYMAKAREVQALLKDIRDAVEEEVKGEAAEQEEAETVDARVSARYREVRTMLLRHMILWYRDILMCVSVGDDSALNYGEHAADIHMQAQGVDRARALRNVAAIETLQGQLERNLGEAIALNHAFGCLSVD